MVLEKQREFLYTMNDFDILPMVKAMLSSNEMYSKNSMDEYRFKNPIELVI